MRQSAPHLQRLTRRSEFQAAAGDGRRFRSPWLTVQVLDRDEGEPLRLGLTASRKVGNAVIRNRVRRRLRAAATEAFAGEQRPCDVVLVARTEVIRAPYAALVDTLKLSLSRATRQKQRPKT